MIRYTIQSAVMVTTILMASCARLDSLEEQTVSLGNRISALESSVETINDNSMALAALYQEQTVIVGKTSKYNSSGEVCGYILEISDGSQVEVTFGDVADIVVPVLAIDGDGNWVVSFDSETFAPVEGAAPAGARDGVTPQVKLDDEGYWVISYDGQQWTRMVNDAGVIVNAFEASASSTAGSSVFKDITEEVRYLDGNMELKVLKGSDCEFGYRSSVFKEALKGKSMFRRCRSIVIARCI